jgi:hypothetical protein
LLNRFPPAAVEDEDEIRRKVEDEEEIRRQLLLMTAQKARLLAAHNTVAAATGPGRKTPFTNPSSGRNIIPN